MDEDFGNREWELPCVCGHQKTTHIFAPYMNIRGPNGEDSHCSACYATRYLKCVHKFVVDNLSLIEQVARARGLV